MTKATQALVIAVIAFVLGIAFPFVGFLGILAMDRARRAAIPEKKTRVLKAARILGVASIVLGVGWTLIFLMPAQPIARGSSPRIYVQDGAEHRLEADVVSGSLYRWAERSDVVRIESNEVDGEHRVRIQNDHEETIASIDSTSLLIVDEHKEDKEEETGDEPKRNETEILTTPKGSLVVAHNAVPPSRAVDAAGVDVRAQVLARDERTLTGPITQRPDTGDPEQRWTLEFGAPNKTRDGTTLVAANAPARAPKRSAVLVLRARSTRFAEEAFFRYLATMGQGMNTLMNWAVKEDCANPAATCPQDVFEDELARLAIPLRVSVMGSSATHQVAIAPVGPAVMRTFAVPLEIPKEEEAKEKITITIAATPGFWDVDHVALAWRLVGEEEIDQQTTTVSPHVAMLDHDKQASDVRDQIAAIDQKRVAIRTGEHIDLRFRAPVPKPVGPRKHRRRHLFLFVRGYYEVPIGGKMLISTRAVLAHRVGLTSLPRFASGLSPSSSPSSVSSTSVTSN